MIYFYFISFYGPKFNMSVYVYYIFLFYSFLSSKRNHEIWEKPHSFNHLISIWYNETMFYCLLQNHKEKVLNIGREDMQALATPFYLKHFGKQNYILPISKFTFRRKLLLFWQWINPFRSQGRKYILDKGTVWPHSDVIHWEIPRVEQGQGILALALPYHSYVTMLPF